jgi:hypothetical protein
MVESTSGASGPQLRRVAMWSGPRNISTALMRSWGNRSDTFVCDEPLYAHYLQHTGLDHPGRDETLAGHETDWQTVTGWLVGHEPAGKAVFYQKHMAHHLLPHVRGEWLGRLTNCFLIRHPREMIPSLAKHLSVFAAQETGLPQQVELFEAEWERTGTAPPVIDARDVLTDPEGMLRKLCDAVVVAFEASMLQWKPGLRETDGAWAPFWYREVIHTTTFQPYRPKEDPVPEQLQGVYEECLPLYETLYRHRLE